MTRTSLFAVVVLVLLSGAAQQVIAADAKANYETTCIACHGPKGKGAIPGVPDMTKEGRMKKSDAELVARIVDGYQTRGSPMAMPPKGGNPGLTTEDAQALVEYLRVLTGVAE